MQFEKDDVEYLLLKLYNGVWIMVHNSPGKITATSLGLIAGAMSANWPLPSFPMDAPLSGEGQRSLSGIHILTDGKPFKNEYARVGRNELCPCGSLPRKKFKKCCEDKFVLWDGDEGHPRFYNYSLGFVDISIAFIFNEGGTHSNRPPEQKNKFVPLWYARKELTNKRSKEDEQA